MSDTTATAPTEAVPKVEKYVRDALAKAGVKLAELDESQAERAASAPGGLRGKALSTFIIEGKNSATQIKEGRAKGGSNAKAPRKNTRKYEGQEWVPDAVQRGRMLTVQKDPEKHARGEHIGYTGPVQHIKVRKFLEKQAGGDPKIWDKGGKGASGSKMTPDQVLQASGLSSFKALRETACFKEGTKENLKALRELGKQEAFDGDGWAKGRFLAAILTVLIEDLKKAA